MSKPSKHAARFGWMYHLRSDPTYYEYFPRRWRIYHRRKARP